MRFESQTILDS